MIQEVRPTRVLAGVLFFLIGLAFFLESLSVWQVHAADFWPVLLISFGVAVLLSRARRIKVEEDRTGQLAVAEERVRIARELHDIVAHSVSLMTIQIAAARRAKASQPEAAENSLKAAEDTGRQTLAELHQMLSMLRGADASIGAAGAQRNVWSADPASDTETESTRPSYQRGATTWPRPPRPPVPPSPPWNPAWGQARTWGQVPPWSQARPDQSARPTAATGADNGASGQRAPLPKLADLAPLVQGLRDAGLDVTMTVAGSPPGLPASVELAIYRVVQEALTNTLRYAGQGRVLVEITYTPEYIVVFVDDEGPGAGAAGKGKDGGGHGLVGMQERIAGVGGTLTAGPRAPGPGWRVHVRIPMALVTR
jgi:signal transduction histidine kinase